MTEPAGPINDEVRSGSPAGVMERIGTQRDILGESPVWDDALGALFWVDIRAPAIRRYDWASGAVETRPVPGLVGSVALARPGRLLVALADRVALYDWAGGTLATVATLPARVPGHRFNDGRCDRQGRFWVGTMHNETRAPEGTLYRLDGDRLTPVLEGICIPNSLAWSPDGRRMYFADSLRHSIEAREYDPATGEPGPARPFAATRPPGFPDGSAVDAAGFLWNAEFNAARLVRHAPEGGVERTVAVPMPNPTACCFGGPGFDRLFVTSTSQRMTEEELARWPQAGALLALDAGVRGVPEPRWAGDAP